MKKWRTNCEHKKPSPKLKTKKQKLHQTMGTITQFCSAARVGG